LLPSACLCVPLMKDGRSEGWRPPCFAQDLTSLRECVGWLRCATDRRDGTEWVGLLRLVRREGGCGGGR